MQMNRWEEDNFIDIGTRCKNLREHVLLGDTWVIFTVVTVQ